MFSALTKTCTSPRNSSNVVLKFSCKACTIVSSFLSITNIAPAAEDGDQSLFHCQILKFLALHLFVQCHYTMDQCLGTRWAACHKHIHRDNFIHTLYNGIVIEHTTAGGTVTHS